MYDYDYAAAYDNDEDGVMLEAVHAVYFKNTDNSPLVTPNKVRSYFPETWIWMETKTGYIIIACIKQHGMRIFLNVWYCRYMTCMFRLYAWLYGYLCILSLANLIRYYII